MKKIQLTIVAGIILAGSSAFSAGMDVPVMNMINGSMGVGGSQVHDMKMINDMKFRYNEYNDYKEVKQIKEEKNKKFELTEPAMQRIYNSQPKENVQFVEQDGQLKIRSIE